MINSTHIINGIDLSNLFDLNKHPVSFKDDHTEHIPEYGSMIYTVWDSDEKFFTLVLEVLVKKEIHVVE